MASLQSVLEHSRETPYGCAVYTWVSGLDPQDREAVEEIINNASTGYLAHRLLTTVDEFSGTKIPGKTSFGEHKRRECLCHR